MAIEHSHQEKKRRDRNEYIHQKRIHKWVLIFPIHMQVKREVYIKIRTVNNKHVNMFVMHKQSFKNEHSQMYAYVSSNAFVEVITVTCELSNEQLQHTLICKSPCILCGSF